MKWIVSSGILAVILSLSVLYYGNTPDEAGLYYITGATSTQAVLKKDAFVVTHIDTPEHVRAIYMTSWVAGTPRIRQKLVNLIEKTEVNAVVIDIKDFSGKIAFTIDDPVVSQFKPFERRITDIKEFIGTLHDKGIYVIGRVTVFQDPNLANMRPDLAVQKNTDKEIWEDYKGLSFTDPSAREVWDYHIAIANGSYDLGFDEINFDYIRFPSDGNMRDIYFPKSNEYITTHPYTARADIMESFFSYLDGHIEDDEPVISADLFGMTTTNYDDLNIGQVLERALPHFDYIAPMVYPSHYPKTFIGIGNPAEHPYEVIKYSLDRAYMRAIAASTSPEKIRPWLQDFDLGAEYTAELVRAQIDATYDAGLSSWMLWDPANIYTKSALKPFYIEEISTTTPQN